jgi:mono/diheme cytochrome c family protein
VKRTFHSCRKCLVLTTLVVLTLVGVKRTVADETRSPWLVPENARNVKNPIKPSVEGLKAAAQLYHQNCELCHSESGSSSSSAAQNLPQRPAVLNDTKIMKKVTDGELFWKITEGRPPMPSYEHQLTETQRWQLVNYIRELVARAQYQYLGNKSIK